MLVLHHSLSFNVSAYHLSSERFSDNHECFNNLSSFNFLFHFCSNKRPDFNFSGLKIVFIPILKFP